MAAGASTLARATMMMRFMKILLELFDCRIGQLLEAQLRQLTRALRVADRGAVIFGGDCLARGEEILPCLEPEGTLRARPLHVGFRLREQRFCFFRLTRLVA